MKNFNLKKVKRISLITILITVCAFVTSITLFYCIKTNNNFDNKEYLESFDLEKLYDTSSKINIIFDKKSYLHFQNECLGNSGTYLAQLGEIYNMNSIECYNSDEKTIAKINKSEVEISDCNSSYINVINEVIYYRNNNDYLYYSYDTSNGKRDLCINERVGQTVVSTKGISFISLVDKSLKYLENGKVSTVSANVGYFYVFGNIYLLLNNSNDLLLIGEELNKKIDSSVEHFVYDGNLIVQKGDKVYRYSNFGEIEEIKLPNITKVITIYNNDLYYLSETNCIEEYKLKSKKVIHKEELQMDDILKGYYVDENETVLMKTNISN